MIDLSKIEMTRNYLGGMSFDTHATREYSYEITNTKLKGTKIRHSIYTPKINDFEWGEQENEYWIEGKEEKKYKKLKELIVALNEA